MNPEHDQPVDRPRAGAVSASGALYSIGAVARIVGVEPATLRSWEGRYGIVVPHRGQGAQRVYSRQEIDQLRFVVARIDAGATAGEAHRLLHERLEASPGSVALMSADDDVSMLILLAERDPFASEASEYFLRTEGFAVHGARDVPEAQAVLSEIRPNLAIVEFSMTGASALCSRLADQDRTPVLAVSALSVGAAALEAGASAFLQKPLDRLELVSTVRDLLGRSALSRRPVSR